MSKSEDKIVTGHEQKETLTVDVNIPSHKERKTLSIFTHSKKALYEGTHSPLSLPREEPGRCWICGLSEEELGSPLEAHHFAIERAYAEGDIDWDKVKHDFPNHDWSTFDPSNPYTFVDNMESQGILLCKPHHTGKDSGIHTLPFSIWIMQRYLKDGYVFSPTEVIHHSHV